jgi:hypothetical protein
MKRSFLFTLLAILIPILILLLLGYISYKPNKANNGFNRKFISVQLKQINSLTNNELYDFMVGKHNNTFFFKNRNPFSLLVSDTNLRGAHNLEFNKLNIEKLEPFFLTYLNYPELFILGGNAPCIIRYNLITKTIDSFKLSFNFTKGVPISKNSFVLRSPDSTRITQVFKKYNLISGNIEEEISLSERIPDGGFTTDGTLHFNPKDNRLYYVYFYQNKFICFDSTLKLIYKANTIDTISTSQVKTRVSFNSNKRSITLSAPPKVVNGQSTVSNNLLYINSYLRADNEPYTVFENNLVIDIYRLTDRKYKGSFYIPKYKREKVISFNVISKQLIVFYKNTIVLYSLNID